MPTTGSLANPSNRPVPPVGSWSRSRASDSGGANGAVKPSKTTTPKASAAPPPKNKPPLKVQDSFSELGTRNSELGTRNSELALTPYRATPVAQPFHPPAGSLPPQIAARPASGSAHQSPHGEPAPPLPTD